MIIRRAFKFRIKPANGHREKFRQIAGAGRWIFNRGLEERSKAYKEQERSISYYEQNNQLVSLKEEYPWLKDIHSQVLQQSLKDLNSAFEHFFRKVKRRRL